VRLATIRDGTRDGRLVVVNRAGKRHLETGGVARSLQVALDDWDAIRPELQSLADSLEREPSAGTPVDPSRLSAPLPRAYEWIDGSAYLSHIILVRKARGAEPPETLRTDPLVYQGGSGVLLGPTDPIPLGDSQWGLDFEAEVCVVLGDTQRGTNAVDAARSVLLVMLANDVTYRHLVPSELAKGFGFFQSKPATAFSPFAVTPDELGGIWRDGRVHRRLCSWLNGELMGDPDAAAMHFSFFDLIAHATRTRALAAGTILGGGTVSNEDPARGVSCLAERRTRETIEHGAAVTPFLKAGDRVRIEMLDAGGASLFGAIHQEVVGG
jgi:fumarylacetoacetate (FAA) hydrolase